MENLDKLLESWQINHMVQVLQLIGDRLKALDELQRLVDDDITLEVQQLQPAVMSSLWIFGPEYESPEFTSNQTISSVIRRFGGDAEGIGSLKRRPDFVITRDGDAVSFRSRDAYDSKHEASGLAHVLIVELKRPTVKIDSRAAQQCRGYVEALYEAGTITATTQVHAISLGRVVASTFQTQEETYRVYDAMTFDDFIRRGEKRLFGLRQKLLDTPMENGTFSDRLESSLGVTGDLF